MNTDNENNHQTLYTTRTNKISSTMSVIDKPNVQQQSESLLTNRASHRKYKLSHSQITKIDKLSRQGLLRWKESRQGQDDDKNRRSNNKSRTSQNSVTFLNSKNQKSGDQWIINLKQNNEDQKDNNQLSDVIKYVENVDKISSSSNEDMKNNKKMKSSSSKNSKKNSHEKRSPQYLHEIKQAAASMHSINYELRKDKIIQLSKQLTLHVEIITFDMKEKYMKSSKQSQQTNVQNYQKLTKQNPIIEVICFEVHDKHINMHYRSQFTYKTLSKDVKFVFQNIQQLFQYVTSTQKPLKNQFHHIKFNRQSMQLQLTIKFQHKMTRSQSSEKNSQQRTKIMKIQLLPFAVIEIVEDHPHDVSIEKQKKQLLQQVNDLKHDLEVSRNLIHALRDENDKLKLKVKKQKSQVEKQKAEKELIIESYEKLSKVSEAANKQYFFQFVPDIKAKNYQNFTFKNNILKKIKNDLKWDQISSEAPLPKAGRHYFSFLIKDFLPDFMFGLVTLKGKDTANAFLGFETICLYASKNNCHIYERGKHYKINVNVKRNDTVFVIIDRQKKMIQWVKKRKLGGNNEKQRSPFKKENNQQLHEDDNNKSLTSIIPHPMHTQDDLPNTSHHLRQRKTSQTIISTQLLTNQLSTISILPLTTAVDYAVQQIQYIHSTTIPQEILAKEIYGYLEVYNINEPLKLNEKK